VSNRTFKRTGRAGVALAVGFAFAAIPVAAQAAPVPINLATASPFVVLGGATVTNTGPSVLNGALGVAPGTALVGFGLPAVVNGATHDNDGVANQAKSDLTTAYDVAAGEPTDATLTGTDLGNRQLDPGTYLYSSSAQLTGPLVLNAHGNANAQFVFKIGTKLTTASASSVQLINGASPCNVFWQVGTSATLGSTTAFKGNLMALASISVNNGVTVQGRLLARNGQVSLINDVIDGSMCGTSTSAPTPTPGSGTAGGSPAGSGNQAPPASRSATPTHAGTARLRRPPTSRASRRPGPACTAGFHATVTGRMIRRVVFSLDGKRIGTKTRPAFRQYVKASAGRSHVVSARVGFKDATHSKTLKFRYRACAAQVLRPRQGPSQFTG
jgi:Ice-binding-like